MDWSTHTSNALEARSLFCMDEGDDLGPAGEEPVAYLNSSYMVPLLKSATSAGMKTGLMAQSQPWKLVYPKTWGEQLDEVRTVFGEIIDAPPSSIAIVPSVAFAAATVAKHISAKLSPDDVILALDEQYQSNALIWQQIAEEKGARVHFVPKITGDDLTSAVIQAIEEKKPILTTLPAHVHWCDGTLLDIVQISEACRSVGSLIFLDGTQSIGAIPMSVREIKPDYLAVAGYKWLCCPYSTGFFYVDEKHHSSETLEMHGGSRKNGGFKPDGSYDIQWLFKHRSEDYVEGARRFDSGENCNFITLPIAMTGLKQVLEWQKTSEVIEHNTPLLDYLCTTAVEDLGMRVPPKHTRAPHMVGLRFAEGHPSGTPARLAELGRSLKQNGIFISIRGDAIRVSPHLWSTKEDIDRLIRVIKEFLANC